MCETNDHLFRPWPGGSTIEIDKDAIIKSYSPKETAISKASELQVFLHLVNEKQSDFLFSQRKLKNYSTSCTVVAMCWENSSKTWVQRLALS